MLKAIDIKKWFLVTVLCVVGFQEKAEATSVIFVGNISSVTVRLAAYGGTDVNIFFQVTSTTAQGVRDFRIVSNTTNDKSALSTVLTARSMAQPISVYYDNTCSNYCDVQSLWF